MAKKSKDVEKETRRLMEGMADLVKIKGDRYKFKSGKKRVIREVKKQCIHWIMRKGKPHPTVRRCEDDNKMWECRYCGAKFPVRPLTMEEYDKSCDELLANVNQLQFLSVKMGGDAEDTKLFLRLKKELPRLRKIQKNIIKHANKIKEWEDNRARDDSMSQFSGTSDYDYRY